MSLVNAPSISIISYIRGEALCTRIYWLDTDGMIREYCQDGPGSKWYLGALDKKHQGSGSISAVVTSKGVDVYTIYSNRINRWSWDGSNWSGGNTENYGQDYVFASQSLTVGGGNATASDETVIVTRNPERVVTYTIKDGRWTPADGPVLD